MPATVDVRSATGDRVGSVTLNDAIFGVKPNVPVMHQVVTAQLAAARAGDHNTLTRAEVRGGGRKPWRQKGSGRARQGSTRAPHWTGGGVAAGPKSRSYRQRTPKKMVQLALRSALSDRASQDRVAVVETWGFETPRTKDARAALAALGLEGRVLVVLDRDQEPVYKSFRNIPEVSIVLTPELNAYDVLCCDWIVFTRSNLPGQGDEPAGAVENAPATDTTATPPEATDADWDKAVDPRQSLVSQPAAEPQPSGEEGDEA